MHLTTISNQFQFNLPTDFLPPGIAEKYYPILLKNHSPYASTLDYLNSTIKDVVLPGSNFLFSKQNKLRKEVLHKAAENIYDTFTREVDVVFRSVQGNFNYIVMLDAILSAKLDTDRQNDPDMFFFVVDENEDAIIKITFRSVLLKKLSECKFTYAESVGEDKTFTLSFAYNYIDIEFLLDETEIIKDDTARQLGAPIQHVKRATND